MMLRLWKPLRSYQVLRILSNHYAPQIGGLFLKGIIMENTIENLVDCLTDTLDYIHDIEMRKHVISQIRQAKETLAYQITSRLEAEKF